MNPAPEDRLLGEYRLKELVSENALSRTWLAEQVSVSRKVLVDELRADQSDQRESFLADVRAKAAVEHPLVGSVYEAVADDTCCFFAHELLPGTNCGACGQPGCLPFAEKLVAGEVKPSQCTVSSAEAIEEIADFLQVDAGSQEKLVARLRCAGGRSQANQIAEYQGFEGCRAAALVSGGGKGCAWGCLGLADCERACTFDAIHMNANGLPQVDTEKCTACPDCAAACPRGALF